MDLFNLPKATWVNNVIPKNTFDKYSNTKLKKEMAESILRITWANNLSRQTTNLDFKKIDEIQIFNIELKKKTEIKELLDLMDKAVPYCIIFVIFFGGEYYLSTSSKHRHPTKENLSVIDWNFNSAWIAEDQLPYGLRLSGSIDDIFLDFCTQMSGQHKKKVPDLISLIGNQKGITGLEKSIEEIKGQIARCKQFNRKVDLNLELNAKNKLLKELLEKQI